MRHEIVRKRPDELTVTPNLVDYEGRAPRSRGTTPGPSSTVCPSGGLNIAHECVDRHANGDRRRSRRAALPSAGTTRVATITYGELADETNRFANVLAALGVDPGSGSSCCSDGCRSCTSPCSAR